MSTEQQTLEQLVAEAQQLSPEDRLRLIQRVAETLIPPAGLRQGNQLEYGKYKSGRMSTEEDFALAEYRLDEQDCRSAHRDLSDHLGSVPTEPERSDRS